MATREYQIILGGRVGRPYEIEGSTLLLKICPD